MNDSDLIAVYRLARMATDAGYYNAAKLFYGAAASLINRQLYSESLPKSDVDIVAAIAAIEPQLAALNLDGSLTQSLAQIQTAITKNKMIAYNEAAPILVCRVCGHIARTQPPDYCPDCGAGKLTFQNFLPVYYLEPEPIELVMDQLARAPDWLDRTLAGLSTDQLAQKIDGAEGEWSLQEAASHLLDSQQLINGRVELFMQHAAPNLSGKSPSEMVDRSGMRAAEIALTFRQSRHHMLDRLRTAPSDYWARVGQHTEFGLVTLQQQVNYFAKHEQWHMAQITRIRKAVR